MTIKLDILGQRYDDSEPAFTAVQSGQFYYHLRSKKLYERLSFNAAMEREGKTFAAGELGTPSDAYIAEHEDMLGSLFEPSVPDVPTSFAVAATVDGALDLSWVDASDNEAGFRIERSGDDITYIEVGSVAPGKMDYVDEGLNDTTLYYYHLYAFNVAGDSTAAAASGTTLTP